MSSVLPASSGSLAVSLSLHLPHHDLPSPVPLSPSRCLLFSLKPWEAGYGASAPWPRAPSLGSQPWGVAVPSPDSVQHPSCTLPPAPTQDSIQEHTLLVAVGSSIPHQEPLPSLALSSVPWHLLLADPERGALCRRLLTRIRHLYPRQGRPVTPELCLAPCVQWLQPGPEVLTLILAVSAAPPHEVPSHAFASDSAL